MDLAKVIPRTFASQSHELAVEGEEIVVDTPTGLGSAVVTPKSSKRPPSSTDQVKAGARGVKVAFNIPSINLELYDGEAVSSTSLQGHSIAKFRLNYAKMAYHSKTDGGSDLEVSLRSITMSNTRAGSSIFREIIPPAEHDGNQL